MDVFSSMCNIFVDALMLVCFINAVRVKITHGVGPLFNCCTWVPFQMLDAHTVVETLALLLVLHILLKCIEVRQGEMFQAVLIQSAYVVIGVSHNDDALVELICLWFVAFLQTCDLANCILRGGGAFYIRADGDKH